MRTCKIMAVLILVFIPFIHVQSSAASDSPKEKLIRWAVEQMVKWDPPGSSGYSEAQESPEEGLRRYYEIASEAVGVVYDNAQQPLFKGTNPKIKTLGVLLSTIKSESQFRRDVDFGIGEKARGDGGKSWCLAQIRLSEPEKNGKTSIRLFLTHDSYRYVFGSKKSGYHGYGGEDLISDRRLCLQTSLHFIRDSFRTCSRSPVEERLSSYVRRDCIRGKEISRSRMDRVTKWFKSSPPPVSDSQVMHDNNYDGIFASVN